MFSALFGFSGRLNRAPFWAYGILLFIAVGIIQSVIEGKVRGLTFAKIFNDTFAMFTTIWLSPSWTVFLLQAMSSIPIAALSIKRRHDRNNPGLDVWVYLGFSLSVALLMLMLGIGPSAAKSADLTVRTLDLWLQPVRLLLVIYTIYLFVLLGFLKGTVGPNNYGPDPLQG